MGLFTWFTGMLPSTENCPPPDLLLLHKSNKTVDSFVRLREISRREGGQFCRSGDVQNGEDTSWSRALHLL